MYVPLKTEPPFSTSYDPISQEGISLLCFFLSFFMVQYVASVT